MYSSATGVGGIAESGEGSVTDEGAIAGDQGNSAADYGDERRVGNVNCLAVIYGAH